MIVRFPTLTAAGAVGALALYAATATAQDKAPDGPILFTNVDVSDGTNETLIEEES